MLQQILAVAASWRQEIPLHVCGIGFGGPVDFPTQTIALSTHVGGWEQLPAFRLAQ